MPTDESLLRREEGGVVKRPASCPGRAEMQLMVGVATYNRPQYVTFARQACTPRAITVPSGF